MEKQWTQIFRGIGDTVTLQSKQPSWATCTIFSINLTSITFVFPIFNLPYLHVLFFSFLLSKQHSDLEPCNPAYKNPDLSIIGAGTFRPFGSLWKLFLHFLSRDSTPSDLLLLLISLEPLHQIDFCFSSTTSENVYDC
jgi:hypothetical protein